MIKAAGVFFQAQDQRFLLVKRSNGGDHSDEWSLPGGKIEDGETALAAAKREVAEELGPGVDGLVTSPQRWVRTQREDVDYQTFRQMVSGIFSPVLNDEHTDFMWASKDHLPTNIHPGLKIIVDRLGMDELQVARAMVAGDLTSPQHYENMAMFAMRITGTGVAYRKGLEEFVYRPPDKYLNQEFLARCNGLPVIVEHPKNSALTSQEFQDRVVGTILLPYIQGDEVWGIAKIFDDTAIDMMENNQLSTSPAVVFREPSGNVKEVLDDGKTLLIEGKPTLLDHLAICEQGVWDKGGEPAGVKTTLDNGGSTVTEEEKDLAAKAAADASVEANRKLDAIMARFDNIANRLDELEAATPAKEPDPKEGAKADGEDDEDMPAEIKGMPEETAADKERKDSARATWKADKLRKDAAETEAKEKEEMAKADADARMKEEEAMKADAVRKRIDELEAKMPKPMSDADYDKMAACQADADRVYSAFGDAAPRPLQGENPLQYRRRLASGLKKHSPNWKTVNLAHLPAEALDIAVTQIYADAMQSALHPVDLPEDELREIRSRDVTGRTITTFAGQPRAWMSTFSANRRRMVGIRNSGSR